MKVKDFKEKLKVYGDDWDIEFNGLTFGRLKMRGEKLVNVEFNEEVVEMRGLCKLCNNLGRLLASLDGPVCERCFELNKKW